MRSYCCIPNCSSSSVDKEPRLSFHEFPTKSHFKNRWLKAVLTRVASDFQLDEKTKNKVCSKHFKETDFSPLCNKRRRLKGYAVPSIFPESEPSSNVLELEIVIKKDKDESQSSCQEEELRSQSFSTCVNHVFTEDENISNDSFGTSAKPGSCTAELDNNDYLSNSSSLKLSPKTLPTSSELTVTSKNNRISDLKTKKLHSILDVFVNNTVDGIKKITARESNVGEFTIFGLYVASQLQQMPLEEAHKMKEKIQNILIQSCSQSLKEPSFFSYTLQSSSDGKTENPYCVLQAKSPASKKRENDKSKSLQPVSSCPVTLQSIVLPSTPISTNNSYKIYRLEGSNLSNAAYF